MKKRFICDEQLGRLARWLRLQRLDTLYECPLSEGRVILTRDRHLFAKTFYGAQPQELERNVTRLLKKFMNFTPKQ